MNRLVIIGNGFDLAHGLPTSYSHFLFDYLKKGIKFASQSSVFEDELVYIYNLSGSFYNDVTNEFVLRNLRNPMNSKLSRDDFKNGVIDKNKIGEQSLLLYKNEFEYVILFKHELLENIAKRIETNRWVDIEVEYFQQLKKAAGQNERFVIRLNQIFEELKRELILYLKTLPNASFNQQVSEIIKGRVDQFSNRKVGRFGYPEALCILNFNYTETAELYAGYYPIIDTIMYLPIHGKLDNMDSIIFGYGDEFDDDYKGLEMAGKKEYLKYIKSFGYSYNSTYQDLIGFTEEKPFEVYIMGHSCGLSDRVMLNTIFENSNCKSIRVFYHSRDDGSNDFIDLYHNIARQFSLEKRNILRKTVVPYKQSINMPQLPTL